MKKFILNPLIILVVIFSIVLTSCEDDTIQQKTKDKELILEIKKNTIELEKNENQVIKIKTGNGGYIVDFDENLLDVVIKNNSIIIKAKKISTSKITIKDSKSKEIKITVKVKDTPYNSLSSKSNISAGFKHVLMIDEAKRLVGWAGGNDSYELGEQSSLQAKKVISNDKWKCISAGYESSLMIKENGTLWALGYNGAGQLGVGNTDDVKKLTQVGTSSDWVKVKLGYRHALGLKKDGTLWSWGINDSYQLGNGTDKPALAPMQVGKDTDWADIETENKQSFAIKKEGSLWAWGYNFYGQLGLGHNAKVSIPTKVDSNLKWIKISAGITTVGGIKEDGSLWMWGKNYHGELGNGLGNLDNDHHESKPIKIESDKKWINLSLGNGSVLGIKEDNTLWVWGKNMKGELGLGDNPKPSYRNYQNIPKRLTNDADWIDIIAGDYFSIALKKDNRLFGFGTSNYNQLGIKQKFVYSPIEIKL